MSEPQQQEEQAQQAAPAANKPLTWPYTHAVIPQPLQGFFSAVATRWDGLGHYLRRSLPSFVVNSSSNIVGGIQLIGEALYYKSTGNDFLNSNHQYVLDQKNPRSVWKDPGGVFKQLGEKLRQNPLKLFTYLFEPPVNIVKNALGKFKPSEKKFELFQPSSYRELYENFVNLERAARIDSHAFTRPLTNNWGALSGLTGMSSMVLATLLPDRKETDQEVEANVQLAQTNPVSYAGKRALQTINPLSWISDKRQLIGLGMLATGLFSFLAGFRMPKGKFGIERQHYERNLGQMFGGLVTAIAGVQLNLAASNKEGWTNYGSTQLLRIMPIGLNLYGRYKPSAGGLKDHNAPWYLGAQAMYVSKNATASLIGGAEQHGGKVVTHDEAEAEGREKAREIKQMRKVSKAAQVHAERAEAVPGASLA